MQVPNESSDGAVHFLIVCEAKFKEFESVTDNRAVRNLSAVFLQYTPVNVINFKTEARVVTVPFVRPSIEGAITQLRGNLL